MGETLASYRDPAGIEHALVLLDGRRGPLLADRSAVSELVVAELGEGEGRDQAVAVLRDAEGNTKGLPAKPPIEGYLARAARSAGPLCRELSVSDLASLEEKTRREAA